MALVLRIMLLGGVGLIKVFLLCVQVITKRLEIGMLSAQVMLAVVALGEILCS